MTTTRRTFLRFVGAGTAATAAATGVVPGLSGLAGLAGAVAPRGRLVVVFLRGGMDGLSAVVPYTEARYYQLRPGISVDAASVLDLDGQFGLHPALAPLLPLYQEGRFAVVEAVGNPAKNRSHFEAQAFLEQGTTGPAADGFGWLGRHLRSSAPLPGAAFRAAGISNNSTRSLAGYAETLFVPSLATFGLGGVSGLAGQLGPSLELLYAGEDPSEAMGTTALEAIAELDGLPTRPLTGVTGDFAAALGDARALLASGLGIEVVTVDAGGWDTHEGMGDETGGEMATLLTDLGASLAAFQAGLDADGSSDVTTIVMSEFGRRVAQNGSGGLDHGYANVMLAMGAGIAGGQVHGTWPGLEAAALVEGDLAATTDFRDVFAELVRDRLGNRDLASVLPGHTPTPVGLTA